MNYPILSEMAVAFEVLDNVFDAVCQQGMSNMRLVSDEKDKDGHRAAGLFFERRCDFLAYIGKNYSSVVINHYCRDEMNALWFWALKKSNTIPDSVKKRLFAKDIEIINGEPIEKIIHSEIQCLNDQIKRDDGDLGQQWLDDCDTVDWLTSHQQLFSSRALVDDMLERCLLWDKSLADQSFTVRAALSALGATGRFMVNGEVFFSRGIAMIYLDDLVRDGVKASLEVGTLYGSEAYAFLARIRGKYFHALLRSHGVYGVADHDGYTCLT